MGVREMSETTWRFLPYATEKSSSALVAGAGF